MHALINISPGLVFNGKKFTKITKSVYGCDGDFFQMNFLENTTILRDNTIQRRKIINCVPYDPYFLLLNEMQYFDAKPLSELPPYLEKITKQSKKNDSKLSGKSLIVIENLADLVEVNGQPCFVRNKEKIRQFLLRKAVNLTKTIKQHQLDGNVIKKTTSGDIGIEITKSALKILKSTVSQYFWDIIKDLQVSYCERKQLQSDFSNEQIILQQQHQTNQRLKATKKAAAVAKRKAEQQTKMKLEQSKHKAGGIMAFLTNSKKKQNNSQDDIDFQK